MEKTVEAVMQGGDHVANLHQIGTEIHLEHLVQRAWMTRALIRAHLGRALQALGFLTTRTPAGDTANRAFIERLGFAHTWSDDHFDYFMLGELPYTRQGN